MISRTRLLEADSVCVDFTREFSMNGQWYYLHDDKTLGPFSEEEIKDHAFRRMLLPNDWLWEGANERKHAVPASVVLDFSQSVRGSTPLPDWMTEHTPLETRCPTAGPVPSEESPAWLEDLRLWVALDRNSPVLGMPSVAVNSTTPAPKPVAEIPDWLEGWIPSPSISPTVPLPPTEAPITVCETALETPTPIENNSTSGKTETAVLIHSNSEAETLLHTSGFDPETGQVLDEALFKKWKHQQALSTQAGQIAVSNASFLEIFRKARTAIEAWVDDEKNSACIMQAGLEEIKKRPDLQAIFQEYSNYGKDLRTKLLKHLEFLVENRRKYYLAMANR
jgi:hypothetical protein